MGLETGSFISALVATNPVGATDPKSQGDDHLRFIKAKLLETFPNITGAVSATHTELNYVDGVTSAIQTQLDAKQPLDADLTAIAALTTTATGRSLLEIANAAAGRTILELETVGKAEAEAGTATTTRAWTAERVAQAIAALSDPGITLTTGSTPYYGARAWVNFNGTGTVAIRGSANVTSITDNNVGDYTINFDNAMPDTNYSWAAGTVTFSESNYTQTYAGARGVYSSGATGKETTSLRIGCTITGSNSADLAEINVVVYR